VIVAVSASLGCDLQGTDIRRIDREHRCSDLATRDLYIQDKLLVKHRIPQPHVGAFTEQPIPQTTATYEQESYTFYDILDYAIGFVFKLRRMSFKFFFTTCQSNVLQKRWVVDLWH
jgi:hypothetical protein